jgi:dipeptidase E
MKLYLSSYGLGNKPKELSNLIGANKRTAVIMNAQDLVLPERRAERLQQEISNLESLGLEPEELDLRSYFSKHSELATLLSNYGALWVRGGNSFVLMRAMKQSGFNKSIIPLVRDEQIVYAGFSAGSCVASPDLHGIELVDDPLTVPRGYDAEIVWDGLNLIDYSIAPHYQSDHPESEDIEKVVDYFKTNNVTYKTLHDGEVLVVSDTDESFVV